MIAKKTELTNLFLCGVVESLFKENTKPINVEYNGVVESKDAYTILNPYFYCFTKDQTSHGFYGMEEEEQENYIDSISKQMQQTMCLCELSDLDMIASKDIDGGNFKGTLTFFIAQDKIAYLDSYVNTLRTKYLGTYETLIDGDGNEKTLIIKFGELEVQDSPFVSQIGMSNICTLVIEFGYLDKAKNYTEEQITLTMPSGETITLPFNQAQINVTYNTTSHTISSNPKGVGEFQQSVSMTMSLSFYEFTKFSAITELRNHCLGVCSTSSSSNDLNFKVVVSYSGYQFNMIVKSWANTIVNTDISNCNIVLSLGAW